MIYLVSDTHHFHLRILEFSRMRYASVEDMNSDIVAVWNSIVKPEDTVFNLGDFTFQPNRKKAEITSLFASLNGKKRITIGNHDKRSQLIEFGFLDEDIFDSTFLTLGDVKFKISHFPYSWGRTPKDLRERPDCMTSEEIDPNTGKIYPLLNGHVHDFWALQPHCLNVGWDVWKRPISEAEILKIFNDTEGFTINLEKYNQGFGDGHQ